MLQGILTIHFKGNAGILTDHVKLLAFLCAVALESESAVFHRIEEHGARRPGDVCDGRAGAALLQKLRYGDAQHPLLRHKTVGLFPSQ